MRVSEIMTTKVITVEMDDNLEVVKEIFDNAKIHHLLVLEDGLLAGVLSDRDLYRSISPNIGTNRFTYKDLETLNKKIHSVMSRHPVTLRPDADVREAIDVFNENSFSCIPIVNELDQVQGIVTWRDIFKKFDSVARACIEFQTIPIDTATT